jgi:hypothetical protein
VSYYKESVEYACVLVGRKKSCVANAIAASGGLIFLFFLGSYLE